MISRTALIKKIAEIGNLKKDTLTRYGTLLSAEGLIPSEGRGPYAYPMDPESTARLLIGFAATSNAKAAPVKCKEYSWLTIRPGHTWSESLPYRPTPLGIPTLLEVLSRVLENPDHVREIERLTICRSWPEARLWLRNGEEVVFGDAHKTYPIREDVTLEQALLLEIARLLCGQATDRSETQSDQHQTAGKP